MKRQGETSGRTAEDWRLDITGPNSAVLTSITGRRRVITFRQCRRCHRWTWTSLATWLVPVVIWLLGMWMVVAVIAAWALGVQL